ncbi:putative membrane protein [Alkalibacillus flavidus]|uniref:Membrane protein n=1 Tax=Alkalibacillus flavidus TaxID=546021 RepID=A0ABV2KTD0_9BACI
MSDQQKQDIEDHKGLAVVAYMIFFIPLLIAKQSYFAMYHANQGLVLLITAVVVNTAGTIIPVIGWLFILPIGNLFVFILWVIGIINAAKGKIEPLPLIGQFDLILRPEEADE